MNIGIETIGRGWAMAATGLAIAFFLLLMDSSIGKGEEGGSDRMDSSDTRAGLTPLQYRVIREGGTEPPFDNEYWDNHEPGLYVDIISGDPLFSSTDKFESGTGWPSFTRPVSDEMVTTRTDLTLGMMRIEVKSLRSGNHLGHIFADGPEPLGTRYCINSASLRFVPLDRLEEEGYGDYMYLFTQAAAEANSSPEAEPAIDAGAGDGPETAILAAGCFWGVEAYFSRVPGVIDVVSGYTGGTTNNPDYREVCSGRTGHAEAVRVTFDPERISYERILEHFLRIHDPTSLNRQGNDLGSQYRSAVFFLDEDQEEAAGRILDAAAERYDAPIVTEIMPAGEFYPAEDYHQDYLEKNPGGYCHIDLSSATEPLGPNAED